MSGYRSRDHFIFLFIDTLQYNIATCIAIWYSNGQLELQNINIVVLMVCQHPVLTAKEL